MEELVRLFSRVDEVELSNEELVKMIRGCKKWMEVLSLRLEFVEKKLKKVNWEVDCVCEDVRDLIK